MAPTGTAGTLRLDQRRTGGKNGKLILSESERGGNLGQSLASASTSKSDEVGEGLTASTLDDGGHPSMSSVGVFHGPSFSDISRLNGGAAKLPPLVFLRPTCVSDAWFILNLLSAVPFFSRYAVELQSSVLAASWYFGVTNFLPFSPFLSLSYVNTMEVLEIAMVEMFCAEEVVVSASKRPELLCVVWEGTLVERDLAGSEHTQDSSSEDSSQVSAEGSREQKNGLTIWHAGDWTGPVALQPDFDRSADKSTLERPRDIVAVSQEGVKVNSMT